MKYISTFILIPFFITAVVTAMENNQKEIQKIKIVKKPRAIHFLTDDCTVVEDDDKCSVINPITNQEVKKINDGQKYGYYIAFDQQKERIVSFNHTGTKIHLYNIKEHKSTYDYIKGSYPEDDYYNEGIYTIDFHSQDKNILATISAITVRGKFRKSTHTYVNYWNIKEMRLIHTTQRLKKQYGTKSADLSFSSDGKCLLVSVYNKCLKLTVPTEITSETTAKNI